MRVNLANGAYWFMNQNKIMKDAGFIKTPIWKIEDVFGDSKKHIEQFVKIFLSKRHSPRSSRNNSYKDAELLARRCGVFNDLKHLFNNNETKQEANGEVPSHYSGKILL